MALKSWEKLGEPEAGLGIEREKGVALYSIAISLKRIADAMEKQQNKDFPFVAISSNGSIICAFENLEMAELCRKNLQQLAGNIEFHRTFK